VSRKAHSLSNKCYAVLLSRFGRAHKGEYRETVMEGKNPYCIIITGPTATGKTRTAARLAYDIKGEIISADSRQVYRGMDIGTGKDLRDYHVAEKKIAAHLIDIVAPGETFSVFEFQRRFDECFVTITERGNVPILAGGTGLYIDAVVRGYRMAKVPEDPELRRELKSWRREDLEKRLRAVAASLHNTTDLTQRDRLIRAIEIAEYTRNHDVLDKTVRPAIRSFVIGLYDDRWNIRRRIRKRLLARLDEGMVEEVKRLHAQGLSWETLDSFGLEYRYVSRYLQGVLPYDEMVDTLNTRINQYAKRQMTWFRRMERLGVTIHWVKAGEYQQVKDLVDEHGILLETTQGS